MLRGVQSLMLINVHVPLQSAGGCRPLFRCGLFLCGLDLGTIATTCQVIGCGATGVFVIARCAATPCYGANASHQKMCIFAEMWGELLQWVHAARDSIMGDLRRPQGFRIRARAAAMLEACGLHSDIRFVRGTSASVVPTFLTGRSPWSGRHGGPRCHAQRQRSEDAVLALLVLLRPWLA